MSIIISKDGQDAQRIDPSSFDKEDYLQQYITNNPDAVPVYEIDEDIRLLILAREFGTTSGPIDALGIDQNGNIYLVETKLYKNADKRTVMAQVLDYGAALWASSLDFSEFAGKLDDYVRKQFDVGLEEKVAEFFGLEGSQYENIRSAMQTNLNDGRFKFVVLMDELHDRLKDLIRFINRNSQFDTYAVELDYYKHDQFEIIIPKLYGAEVKKEIGVKTKASARRPWNEQSFFEELDRQNPASKQAIKKLYKWSAANTQIKWGNGAKNGSFNAIAENFHSSISIISAFTDGTLNVKYGWFDEATASKLLRSLQKHVSIKGLTDIEESRLSSENVKLSPDDIAQNIDGILSALNELTH